jgi:hypothetical protein
MLCGSGDRANESREFREEFKVNDDVNFCPDQPGKQHREGPYERAKRTGINKPPFIEERQFIDNFGVRRKRQENNPGVRELQSHPTKCGRRKKYAAESKELDDQYRIDGGRSRSSEYHRG